MYVLLFDVFNRCSLIQLRKEINQYSNVKRQTFTAEKNQCSQFSIFSKRKFEEIQ